MVKIAILITSLVKGGAERVVNTLLHNLSKDKFDIYLVLLEDNVEFLINDSISKIILSKHNKYSIGKLLELPFLAIRLKKILRKNKIPIVLSFLYRSNYINVLAKLYGSKHRSIISIRNTTSLYLDKGLLGRINLFLVKILFGKADLIVSNSLGVKDDLNNLFNFKNQHIVIPNPYNLNIIHRAKEEAISDFNFEKNKKYIITIGRLIEQKRKHDLLYAFHLVQKKIENCELIIIGDGVDKVTLRKLSLELHISNKSHFLGIVDNPFKYLNSCFVLIE